jgi:CubicO group peptidase (beta-lactamase class C family)
MIKRCILSFVILVTCQVKAQGLYFPPNVGDQWDTIHPQSLGWCQPKIDNLYAYLDTNNTKAFILLKDGKIVLEKYFGTHTAATPWYWASAGKTITSFMVGMAQQDGYLSIEDTTSQYLGQGWTNTTPSQEERITIRNQLTMTSGLDDAVVDPYCTLNTCLDYVADAGTRWAYHNGPYTLLDSVIEIATGQTLNAYTTQRLKIPTGMTGSFYTVDYNHVFLSTARSMARFGLLILNQGNWNGNQIMTDQTYFNDMVNTSQNLNLSYGYLWWLNGKSSFMVPQSQFVVPESMNPNAPDDMIAALGKNGQFINVVPSQNMTWIRMGDAPDNSFVPFLLNDGIWQYINELSCSSETIELSVNKLDVYPNPANGSFILSCDVPLQISITNAFGQEVMNTNISTGETNFTLEESGIYFLHSTDVNGQKSTKRFIIF